MRALKATPNQFEFHFPDLDNSVLVETSEDSVTIRAVRDNFSERRKRTFIRHLAAEGFIPDHYRWFCGTEDCSSVKWVRDCSWLKLDSRRTWRGRQFMRRLLLCGALLWLILMSWLFFFRAHPAPSEGGAPTIDSRHLSADHGTSKQLVAQPTLGSNSISTNR